MDIWKTLCVYTHTHRSGYYVDFGFEDYDYDGLKASVYLINCLGI